MVVDDAALAGQGDTALVLAMVRRDPGGLEAAYRRYADRLHAYCRSILGDREAASDVVHDTFVIASRQVGQLREPERLRSWLYAIARRESLRQVRRRARTVPLPDEALVPGEQTDPAAAAQSHLIRELVSAAVAGLNDSDRDIVELTTRHGFGAAEIAATLGISTNHAHARMSRARGQLADCLGVLLVARGTMGAGDGIGAERRCAELAKMLHGWDGRLTPLLRKRLHRHISSCAVCSAQRAQRFNPAALLAAYTALPFLVAADATWPRLDRTLRDPASRAGQDILDRAGPFDPTTGFPVPTATTHGRRRATVAAVAIGVVSILVGGLIGLALAATGADPSPTEPANAAPGGIEPELANPSPTAGGPASGGPGGAAAEGLGSAPAPPTTTGPPPLNLTATASVTCTIGEWYTITVDARLTGGSMKTATLYYFTPVRGRAAMTITGSSATATLERLRGAGINWWVDATATDGRTATTTRRRAENPCP